MLLVRFACRARAAIGQLPQIQQIMTYKIKLMLGSMNAFRLIFIVVFLSCSFGASAQQGYEIEVDLKGYAEDVLYLGYHYGNKQYLLDTVEADAPGHFVFKGEEPLEGGVYLVVMAPDNNYLQLLVTAEEQRFSFSAEAANPTATMAFEGAADNQLFYDYMRFLDQQKPKAEELAKALEATENEKKKAKIEAEREALDAEVTAYQNNLLSKYPKTLTAAIVRANMPLDVPEFEGTDEEKQLKGWRYTQKHYFDNIDLTDPRMLRTPFLFQRVDYFVNKLQVQHPDTMAQAVDYVLKEMKPAEESYKFFLIHFLNEAARSKLVGMDALYVHLVEKYYATGKADWTEEEQLKKIVDNARALKPLLIGKIAPDVQLQDRDGKAYSLHDIDSEYTILYFWRYDCGHCKKSTPHMKAFYEKYKDKGVKLVAVCTKFTDEVPGCWEYIDEKEIGDWLHLVDPYHRSRYMTQYNIKSTPQLFILDRNKEIISKRIGAEQLEEVMDRIIEMKAQEEQSLENK